MNAPTFFTRSDLTPTQAAIEKRKTAKAAIARRFFREASGKSLSERMRLSITYQWHLDDIDKEYRRDMELALAAACKGKVHG